MLYSEPLLSVRTLQSLQPRPALSRERHEGAWQRVGKAYDDALQRCKILQAVRISLPHLPALLFEPDIAEEDTHSCLTDTPSPGWGKSDHGKNQPWQTAELHSEIGMAKPNQNKKNR